MLGHLLRLGKAAATAEFAAAAGTHKNKKAFFCAPFHEGNCRALDVLLYIAAVVLISVFHDTHRGGLPVFTRHLEEGALVALRRKEKREENED